MSTQHLSLKQVESLTMQALTSAGASKESASSMAKAVKAAERDGIPSHGLLYVPTYCEHIKCGKVDGNANPDVCTKLSSALLVCLLYTSPSPRDGLLSRMPSSA